MSSAHIDVALDHLVKGGQVRVEDAGRVEFLWDEIRRLKRDKRAARRPRRTTPAPAAAAAPEQAAAPS